MADRAGNIWRTDSGGATWRALREAGSGSGLPTREDLLLDLDVRLSELVDRAGLDDPSRDPADDAWRQAELRDELLADHELLPDFVFRDLPGAAAAAVDLEFVDGVLWARLADGWWFERGATLVPAPGVPPDPERRPTPSWLPQASLSADCRGLSPVAVVDGGLFELRPAGPRPVEALGGSPSPLSLACDASGALWVLTPEALWSFEDDERAAPRASSLDLPALLDAAASRVGLQPQHLRSRRTLAAFTPTLVAEATVGETQVDRWAGALGTVRQELLGSGVVVRAVWRPRAPGRASSWRARGDLVVVEGEVLPLTGRDDHVALSSLARAAHRYTAQVQRVVANLVDERAVLAGREPRAATLPEQVQVALAVAEVDALLDALCDGAASRAPRAP